MKAAHRPIAGFTLVEMLVVMAIFGIVAAIAAPSFRDYALRRSIAVQVSDLAGALRLARSEALKRGKEVSLCPSQNTHVIKPSCNAEATNWGQGYLVFVGSVDRNDQFLRAQQPYGSGGSITANVKGAIRFNGNGVLRSGGARQFTFTPPLNANDRSYKSLTHTVCLTSNGVLLPGSCS
ncbi:MAG: GspH/FimT family pseudopilin [Lautropia sp.]|nr:GspH/FimT family pseudopilin [Lautropia sp.]